jgi:galactose mutarotase-like enzyme
LKYFLQSSFLCAEFSSLGAELLSLKSSNNTELIWQGENDGWPGHAPILFPICGFLKNDSYIYNNRHFPMSAHGFASKSEFSCLSQSDNSLTFELHETEESLNSYPFQFTLQIVYTLTDNQLSVKFSVTNRSDVTLPFSLGWHPGFNTFTNAQLVLPKPHKYQQRQVFSNGLIGNSQAVELQMLLLNEQTFKNGGIVLEGKTNSLELINPNYSLVMELTDFPALVLWGQPGKGFVCIEPWLGMGDLEKGNSKVIDKENIVLLEPNKSDIKRVDLHVISRE